MGIGDLFRPKHKHSNPDVRADAVRALSADQAELVCDIAKSDDDDGVRKIAISQLHDPAALIDVARAQSVASLERMAQQRAVELWLKDALGDDEAAARIAVDGIIATDDQMALADIAHKAASVDVRQLALARLSDAKALAELARSSTGSEVRLAALERIDDPEVLRSIAVDEQRKAVAFAALDRIDDVDSLQNIAAKAKNKAVRSRARKKVAERDTPARPAKKANKRDSEGKRRHAERVQLVREAQWLANTDDWSSSQQKMDELRQRWLALGDPEADNDAKLQRKLTQSIEKYEKRRARYAKAAHKNKRPEPEQKAAPALTEAETETETETEAETETETETETQAEREARKAERAKRQAEAVETAEALCKELEDGLKLKKLKSADRLLQSAQKRFENLHLPGSAKDLAARFDEARNQLFIKVQELREADDWQRWANVPKCEALIKRAEALLADEAAQDLGKQLKELQSEWKQSSALPKTRADALWESFKATCDQIYERVKIERGHQAEQRKRNLHRKEELCDKVEALADSTEWKETADKIKALQAEWKNIGPVPRRKADAVWKRFRGACDRFFEARKPHLEANLAEQKKHLEAKRKLMERAEALAESTEWRSTAAELKDLQSDWRNIGHAPRKEGAEVAKRFRAACDLFFSRLEQHRQAERDAEVQRIQGIADEIDSVRKIAAGEAEGDDAWVDAAELVQRLLAVRTQFLELDGRDQSDAMRDNLAKACFLLVEAHADKFEGTELDPTVSRKRKEKLVARAEELAPKQDEAAAVDPSDPQQVAERLRKALAENALGVNKDDGSAVAEIAELEASWQRLGPVPGAIGTELETRFRSACERTRAAHAK